MKKYLRIFCLLTLLGVHFHPSLAQVNNATFGKNRVQYHDDFEDWQQYETRNFITYFYGKSRPVAEAAIMLAEYHHDDIQKLLEYRFNEKIELIVYSDLTDLKQSNIGNEEVFTNTGGNTKIVGKKIFVYSNGNMNDLQYSIREGIARVYLNSMMFGSNLQEIVQNAVFLDLPTWFKEGLVHFTGQPWNVALDSDLRTLLQQESLSFEKLSYWHPQLVGHAMWYYISQQYGEEVISDVLYLTRINHDIEQGFAYAIGEHFDRIQSAWLKYFQDRYASDLQAMNELPDELIQVRNRKHRPITSVALSADGQRIAYATNDMGRVKVYVYHIHTGQQKRVFASGQRNALQATDYNYPLLDWRPDGQSLAILYEKRDKIYLDLHNLENRNVERSVLPERYRRVFDMDFFDNNQLVFSAATNGYSDLYLYRIATRQSTPLTQDFYSDLEVSAVHIDSVPGILFSSNRGAAGLTAPSRLDTSLPVGQFDIFFLRMPVGTPPSLQRLTHTADANESQPCGLDSTHFTYLTDAKGQIHRKQGYIQTYFSHYNQRIFFQDGSSLVLHADTALTAMDTTLIDSIVREPVYAKRAVTRSISYTELPIRFLDIAVPSGMLLEVWQDFEQSPMLVTSVDTSAPEIYPPSTSFKRNQVDTARSKNKVKFQRFGSVPEQRIQPSINVDSLPPQRQDTGKVEIESYFFQSEFEDETPTWKSQEQQQKDAVISLKRLEEQALNPDVSKSRAIERFIPSRITPYRLRFRMNYFTTQMNNDLLFGGLDGYSGLHQSFDYMPAGVLLKANFSDLLEDHALEGGVRIPLSFNGTEFFVVYDNKKKRIDKRYAVYRRSFRDNRDLVQGDKFRLKETMLLGMYQLSYPFDIFRSLRTTVTLRHDEAVRLATDLGTLNAQTNRQQRMGLRLAYVYDNTLLRDLNLLNGTRYRIFVEAIKRFKVDFTTNETFTVGNGFMGVVGADVRHYQPVLRHSVLAVRLAGETSFGAERILYYLGGTDNWLLPSFNNALLSTAEGEFAYQTLATNMRGFPQNARNGSSYALINLEMRVPIVKYIDKRVRNAFFKNLQLVGFVDAGTAWLGTSPFAEDNPINTRTYSNSKVTLVVNYFKDPMVVGYGGGLRTMLFGYFVRLDYAWGFDSGLRTDPRLHISLGTDF